MSARSVLFHDKLELGKAHTAFACHGWQTTTASRFDASVVRFPERRHGMGSYGTKVNKCEMMSMPIFFLTYAMNRMVSRRGLTIACNGILAARRRVIWTIHRQDETPQQPPLRHKDRYHRTNTGRGRLLWPFVCGRATTTATAERNLVLWSALLTRRALDEWSTRSCSAQRIVVWCRVLYAGGTRSSAC
jgi:hypothetical protein